MKCGARRKTTTSDLPPPPAHPVQNEIEDEATDQVKYDNQNRKHEHQPPMNDGENSGSEYDQEENEDYEEEYGQSGDLDSQGEREDGGETNGDEKRPKLAEGFYEIEAVRKKRTRKGVEQYLIKWRGWPESANTWEPVENLMACLDLIDAFEESKTSGRFRSKRKRKVGPTPESKKKQNQQLEKDSPDAEYPIPSVKLKIIDEPNTDNITENELDQEHDEIKPTSSTNRENTTEFGVHIQENQAAVEETDVLRASPRFGARRRKSSAVKRFKKEPKSVPDAERTTADSVEDEIQIVLDSENVVDTPQSVSVITKILKPVNYTTSVINDTEQVCVSFLVRRSDGEEVVVDNKYLKEHNPILLINFYEQHLRYNSPGAE